MVCGCATVSGLPQKLLPVDEITLCLAFKERTRCPSRRRTVSDVEYSNFEGLGEAGWFCFFPRRFS
jgi:hypothetical protein